MLEEFNQSKKIYGSKTATLNGTATWSRPDIVLTGYIGVPRDIINSKINMFIIIDVLFVNKVSLFITISHNIKFTTINFIIKRTLKQIIGLMGDVNSLFSNRLSDINTSLLDS